MHRYCVEEHDVERFLKEYVPGEDPTAEELNAFYHPGQMEGLHEVQVNTEIVSIRNSFYDDDTC